ncbi:archaeosine synthase subunit alpha [Halorhabdus amylolytica]|uniref:archaeosine synthase subunit alpha n=1 Tax=Halorhabdus amylolytica TaxID=2559573 RepID=UPI0010AAC7A3|nr:archaeosine synthase subunit alpha [Halorhabdus amylolytica]
MTEYFEVIDRDGAARIGDLRLAESITTPALIDDVLTDAGSLWTADRSVPDGDEETLTVLPHRGFPAGTPDEVQTAFDPAVPDIEYPTAAVVTPETAADHGTDAYVLSGGSGLVGHSEAFVDAIVATRESIPPDAGLYLPGVATPGNVATLAYAGVDLFDTDRAVVRGTQGWYLTPDGEFRLDALDELPCACEVCRQGIDEFDREDCLEHNVATLEAELAAVRNRIREGRLRDYLEGQARHEQWLTATFRRLDDQYAYLEQRTPLVRKAEITAASAETLDRVEIQRFAERVTERYRCRFDAPLVLVPCSATKPYSDSQSHGQFQDAIHFRGHVASMTSPIGVVPQELELTYPAQHYDSVVTGRWSETEIEFVVDVLEAYLESNEYPRVIAHVPEDYRAITERVEERLDREFEYTVEAHPTTDESLANLSEALAGKPKYRKRERQHNVIRAIADYQFGAGAGEAIFGDLQVESHYPKLRANDADGEQLAAMVPEYGVLSLTLAGARRWIESDVPTKRVEIGGFVPHGSVLAPGILDADESIRVGDEVVFEGPDAFAVGRANMSGPEMARSSRGIASEVRHVTEK